MAKSNETDIDNLLTFIADKLRPILRAAASSKQHGIVDCSVHISDGVITHVKSGFHTTTQIASILKPTRDY